MSRRRSRRICWRWFLGLVIGVAGVIAGVRTPTFAADSCDVDFVRAQIQRELPDYRVDGVRAGNGMVVLLFDARDRVGTCAVALRASGTRLFTSVMGAQLDGADVARISRAVGNWYERAALQEALARCCAAVPDARFGETGGKLRAAAEAALTDSDRGGELPPRRAFEPAVVVGALAASLTLVLWPVLRRRRRPTATGGRWRVDQVLVLCAAAAAVAIATTIAWHLVPEGDEIVTLGTRHAALPYLLSWSEGGEPFNPPGSATLFALWLRLGAGFFWGRALSIAFIPLTAWAAYHAGAALGGRSAGVTFAAMVVLAPAYLRLAAIARAYAIVVFALCALLALLTRGGQKPSRGEGLGVACLFALWVSYLLWPLALAAPWIARLDRRDRVRVVGALALTVASLLPRVANGVAAAGDKSGMFEIHGPADAFGYALGAAGLAPPPGYGGGASSVVVGGRALAATLILIAIARLWQRDRRHLRDALLVVALTAVPVLALLSGAHGIRDRHVIALQVALALVAATGLGLLIAPSASWRARSLGGLLATALAVCCVAGNWAVVRASDGWIAGMDRLRAGADLIMIVPRDAQGAVHAMLFGDAPEGSETVRWPPVCELGTERPCRRVGELRTVSVDEVSDDVLSAASAARRSLWIFRQPGTGQPDRDLAPRLQRCDQVRRDSTWRILVCSNTNLPPQ